MSGFSVILSEFFFYSFLGFCVEVIYARIKRGHFVNRGFLCGPVCPIYGAGILLALFCFEKYTANLFLLWILSVLLASSLELLTGFLLDRIFHRRWWDYSDEKFNIGGYVCLRFSLLWGFCICFVLKVISPFVTTLTATLPAAVAEGSLAFAAALFFVDLLFSVRNAALRKDKAAAD